MTIVSTYRTPISKFFQWLSANTKWNVLLILVYGGAIIFLHDTFVNLSISVMNSLTLPVYNTVVAIIAALFAVALLLFIVAIIKKPMSQRKIKLTYLGIICFVLFIHGISMLEMNIELIHALEFSVLTVLIYPLIGRFGGAIAFTLPFMLLDEYIQYVHLYPEYVEYFEFNDIVLDLLGSGLAMCLIWLLGVHNNVAPPPMLKRPEFYLVLILFLVFFWSIFLPSVELFDQKKEGHFVYSSLEHPFNYWQTHPFTKRVYHVLTPIEGVVAILAIMGFYFYIDKEANKPDEDFTA